MPKRRAIVLLALAALVPIANAQAPAARDAVLYKNPDCGCCEEHAQYLRHHGYRVKVVETHDLDGIRRRNGVPDALAGCHTIEIGGYVIEGHVSAPTLTRLLRERPPIRGISLPGMPQGSPGMTGQKSGAFKVLEIGTQAVRQPRVYAIE